MAHRMKKTIITAALTGSVAPMGYDIPTTPEQIAEDAYACWKQGAAIVHLHMRDSTGAETADPAMFAKTIRLIRERRDCDVIIDCASSCGPGETDGMRLELFRQLDGVEMGSFSAGSFNLLPETLCVNSPEFLKALGSLYLQRGIKPEVHIFDTGMLAAARYFAACGSLAIPCHYQLCLGVPGGIEPTVGNLAYLVERLPRGSTWSAFGVGEAHMPMLYAAIALGGPGAVLWCWLTGVFGIATKYSESLIAVKYRVQSADGRMQADGLRLPIRNQERIPQAGMGNRMQTDAAQHAGGTGCVKAEADGLPAPEVERAEQRNAEHAVLRILEGGGGRIADEHAPPAADQLKDQLGVLRMQFAEIQFEPQLCRTAHILRKGSGQGKRRIGRRGFR